MKSIVATCSRWFVGGLLFLQVGCGSMGDIQAESPTLQLLRGDLHPEDYREAVTAVNERERAREAFERNREPTRAYNTKTGKFEYLPEDSAQEWNPETERWEFTPNEDMK